MKTVLMPLESPGSLGPVSAIRDWPREVRAALSDLRLSGWTYHPDRDQLVLGGDGSAMLEMESRRPLAWQEFADFFTEESADALRRAFVLCMSDGRSMDLRATLARPRGGVHCLRVMGERIAAANSDAITLCGALRPVRGGSNAPATANPVLPLPGDPVAFATLDANAHFMYTDDGVERLLRASRGQLLGQPVSDHLVGRDTALLQTELTRSMERGVPVEFEDFYPALDAWIMVQARPFPGGLGLYLHDVTERHAGLQERELLLSSIERINDSVVIIRTADDNVHDARVVFVNQAFERLSGLGADLLVGKQAAELRPIVGAHAFDRLVRYARQSRDGGHSRPEFMLPQRDGNKRWIELDVVALHDEKTSCTHWVAVGRDVTERKLAEQQVQRLAFFDSLTQLPNRQLLMDRLQVALAVAERSRRYGALLFIDLDSFKALNDTRGHQQGDQLLQQVAQRLSARLRKSDTVARIGGDEFVVLLQDLDGDAALAAREAHEVASELRAEISRPFDLGGYQHYCTASIGLAGWNSAASNASELLKRADLAMYSAKSSGGNAIAFYDAGAQSTLNARTALINDLRRALEAGDQFVLYYQPQFDRKRRMAGVEALLRWQHPEHGLMSPARFIPLAEETGLIATLGAWVLDQACAQLAAWRQEPATAGLTVAVNVSVKQFRHRDFVRQVLDTLERHDVAPHRLTLELTESLLADHLDLALARMHELKRHGVSFALDDFGTGYSSLSYLKHLRLDQLKIDQSFVSDVLDDSSAAAIAQAIVNLGHNLHLPVVAEGVETEAQRRVLMRCGCDYFQGYLFARPMPAADLEQLAVRR